MSGAHADVQETDPAVRKAVSRFMPIGWVIGTSRPCLRRLGRNSSHAGELQFLVEGETVKQVRRSSDLAGRLQPHAQRCQAGANDRSQSSGGLTRRLQATDEDQKKRAIASIAGPAMAAALEMARHGPGLFRS